MKITTVRMLRENLEDLPEYFFPAGYGYRCYRPGDEQTWIEIHQQADKTLEYSLQQFEKEFSEARDRLHDSQYYIIGPDGNPVGTATAWMRKGPDGLENGLVHWVAIIPQMQGKGLAKPLMSTICHKFVQLGYNNARLVTDSARLPAISLYLKFGFIPEIHTEKEYSAWVDIMDRLGTKSLSARISQSS